MEGGNFLKEKLEDEEGVKEITGEKREMEKEVKLKKPRRDGSFVRNWGGWLRGDE